MKHRKAAALMAVATVLMVAGTLCPTAIVEAQDPPTKTMFALGRGQTQVIRLYDKPDPRGTTMKQIPTGLPIEVLTDQLYNKFWYKTTEGFYVHALYLTEADPSANVAEAGAEAGQQEVDSERENELLQKYGDLGLVSKILAGVVEMGYTMDQVRDAWGGPDSTLALQDTAMGTIWQWVYSGRGDRQPIKTTTLKFDERKKIVDIKTEK